MEQPPEGAQYSDDGYYQWDGTAWVPAPDQSRGTDETDQTDTAKPPGAVGQRAGDVGPLVPTAPRPGRGGVPWRPRHLVVLPRTPVAR